MSGQIFISYRRDDAPHLAGRLYDRFSARFPKNQIFIDVDNIEPGVDFVKAIEKSVGSCDVLIAVIGHHWLAASDQRGRRRLDNLADFVRVEIGTALKRDIRVIPVLVDGASMPQPGDLPDDLKSLVNKNALEVDYNRFNADSERLISAIERALEAARTEQQRKLEKQEALSVAIRLAEGYLKPQSLTTSDSIQSLLQWVYTMAEGQVPTHYATLENRGEAFKRFLLNNFKVRLLTYPVPPSDHSACLKILRAL